MRIKTHLKSIMRASALTLLAINSIGAANAIEKTEAIEAMNKVYDATINSYYSINGFYNFSANQADQEQQQQVQYSIGTVEDLMLDISNLIASTELASQVDVARDAWLAYEDSLNENVEVVKDTGYTDLRLVGDLANFNIAFNDSLSLLYRSLAEAASIEETNEELQIHKIGKMLALMMTKYSARSTSTVSQVYAREDEDVTLDSLAKDFNKALNALVAKETSEDAANFLDSAKTKWEFIEPSYINYNENRVNFIVNLYSRKIIEDLEAVSQI